MPNIKELDEWCKYHNKAIKIDKISRRRHREARLGGFLGKRWCGGYNHLPTTMINELHSLIFVQLKPIKVMVR